MPTRDSKLVAQVARAGLLYTTAELKIRLQGRIAEVKLELRKAKDAEFKHRGIAGGLAREDRIVIACARRVIKELELLLEDLQDGR